MSIETFQNSMIQTPINTHLLEIMIGFLLIQNNRREKNLNAQVQNNFQIKSQIEMPSKTPVLHTFWGCHPCAFGAISIVTLKQ